MMKILQITDYSSGYSRSLLRGVIRYSKKYGPWSFYKIPQYYRELHGEDGIFELAREWKADAIIAQMKEIDVNKIQDLGIPIIVQNYRERNPMVSNLTGDYYLTGTMGARYFLEKGFKHFAYYGTTETVWSQERCQGFVDEIEKMKFKVSVFGGTLNRNNSQEWRYDPEELSRWLLALPKPLALFACDDYFAQHITDTCILYKIPVPDDIAVLGVDNDDLICSTSNPPLSSIIVDGESGGFEVGRLIHRLVEKRLTGSFDIVVKPLEVMERASTDRFAVEDCHLMTIVKYIHQNLQTSITVADLNKLVPLSRRVLEKRFRKVFGTSMYNYLLSHRVENLARKLILSDAPLGVIAGECGFTDTKNLSRVFSHFKGITPLQYRQLYGNETRQREVE